MLLLLVTLNSEGVHVSACHKDPFHHADITPDISDTISWHVTDIPKHTKLEM